MKIPDNVEYCICDTDISYAKYIKDLLFWYEHYRVTSVHDYIVYTWNAQTTLLVGSINAARNMTQPAVQLHEYRHIMLPVPPRLPMYALHRMGVPVVEIATIKTPPTGLQLMPRPSSFTVISPLLNRFKTLNKNIGPGSSPLRYSAVHVSRFMTSVGWKLGKKAHVNSLPARW